MALQSNLAKKVIAEAADGNIQQLREYERLVEQAVAKHENLFESPKLQAAVELEKLAIENGGKDPEPLRATEVTPPSGYMFLMLEGNQLGVMGLMLGRILCTEGNTTYLLAQGKIFKVEKKS